jgi:Fe-S-cluster containining protein
LIKTDKDRPSTWVKYRNGLCEGCYGSCCTMPVEVRASDLLRLGIATVDEVEGSKKKLGRRLIKERLVMSYREGTDLYMLAHKPNGDCAFLDSKTRLCTVYEKRPDVCREFPSIGPRPGFCPSRRVGSRF